MSSPSSASVHRLYEDISAGLTGTLMVALGATLYTKATLLTGGTAGLALLLKYATAFDFDTLFFAINLPFYALSLIGTSALNLILATNHPPGATWE